jgi:lipoyl-dependent peroxiredoxin
MIRNATAVWNGTGKEGNGQVTTASKALNNNEYSYKSRFVDENSGSLTNPEELIAAAHASCFSMKLSFILGDAGFTPDKLETKSDVSLENGVVTKSHLTVKGTVPGISKEKFEECVKKAEKECPISKALNLAISSEATLA